MAAKDALGRRGEDLTVLIVLNGHHDLVQFTLPDCAGGNRWARLIDTNLPHDDASATFPFGEVYGVTGGHPTP